MGIDGPVEVGDQVKTLHLKRAIYGTVTHKDRKGYCTVVGAHYPGGPEQRCKAHEENLEIEVKGNGLGQ